MTWTNDDGLEVKFGTELARPAKAGIVSDNHGGSRKMEMLIDIASDGFPAFGDADAFLSKTSGLPNGAIIRSATMIIIEAFTSAGAPTFDAGLKNADGTELDHNGLFAAVALASMATVGAEIAGAGALINTKLAANGLPSINVNVADYTAGKAKILVDYMLPS